MFNQVVEFQETPVSGAAVDRSCGVSPVTQNNPSTAYPAATIDT